MSADVSTAQQGQGGLGHSPPLACFLLWACKQDRLQPSHPPPPSLLGPRWWWWPRVCASSSCAHHAFGLCTLALVAMCTLIIWVTQGTGVGPAMERGRGWDRVLQPWQPLPSLFHWLRAQGNGGVGGGLLLLSPPQWDAHCCPGGRKPKSMAGADEAQAQSEPVDTMPPSHRPEASIPPAGVCLGMRVAWQAGLGGGCCRGWKHQCDPFSAPLGPFLFACCMQVGGSCGSMLCKGPMDELILPPPSHTSNVVLNDWRGRPMWDG